MHGLAEFFGRLLAHGVDVVADHGGHAGLIDEHRRRIVFVDDFLDGFVEPLLSAEHDVVFVHVGGEAGPVELRARGFGAAIVPGIAFAGDGPMHEMRDVGDGLERDLCAIEGAAARRPAGLQLLGAALLALFFGLALILAAARLVEDVLDFIRERIHSRLLGRGVPCHGRH